MEDTEAIFLTSDFTQICKGLVAEEIELVRAAVISENREWGKKFRLLPRHKQIRLIAAICAACELKSREGKKGRS